MAYDEYKKRLQELKEEYVEYKRKLKELRGNYKREEEQLAIEYGMTYSLVERRRQLAIEYAKEHNPVKIGDIVTDHKCTIKVDRIVVDSLDQCKEEPTCLYYGFKLTKKGDVFKNDARGVVRQSDLKEINKVKLKEYLMIDNFKNDCEKRMENTVEEFKTKVVKVAKKEASEYFRSNKAADDWMLIPMHLMIQILVPEIQSVQKQAKVNGFTEGVVYVCTRLAKMYDQPGIALSIFDEACVFNGKVLDKSDLYFLQKYRSFIEDCIKESKEE